MVNTSVIQSQNYYQVFNLSPCFMYKLKYCSIHVLLLALDTYGLFNATQHAFYQDGKTEVDDDKRVEVGVQ